jgi:hypothetical protein
MALYKPKRLVPLAHVPGLKAALETVVVAACSGTVMVGKYKGYSYAEVSFDRAYCSWVLSLQRFNGDNQFQAWLKLRQASQLLH